MKKTRRPKIAATETCLTPGEAAALLNVSVGTLQAWRRAGTGPVYTQHGPKTVRYRTADLLAFQPPEAATA